MRVLAAIFLVLLCFTGAPDAAQAAKLKTLWSFCTAHFCTDGQHPTSGVLVDKFGDAFGTTAGDLQGDPNGDPHKATLFGVGPGLTVAFGTPYYRFVEFCSAINCTDGAQTASNILGTLSPTSAMAYGTAVAGGANNGGAIFKATLDTHQTIYSFCGKTDSFSSCADGKSPGDIVTDSSGNIYGTTAYGGANIGSPSGPGVLYKLGTNGILTVLHDFCGQALCVDGVHPYGRQLALYKNVLYGTTWTGGKFNSGVVFRYDLGANQFAVLYSFCKKASCVDGQYPQAGVTFDTVNGILYGTTEYGGKGKGVLYAITNPTAAPGAINFVLMKLFCSAGGNCVDGAYPGWAPAADGAGNLVGATYIGGVPGNGLLYELTGANSNASYKVLYTFCTLPNCADGRLPEGPLTLFPAGKSGSVTPWTTIYGTTTYGGANNDGGTVFTYTP